MVKLKICGMRRAEDIEMANSYKPDYIGFVFAESPRKVSYEQAKELSDLLSEDIVPVGVFVNEHMKLIVDLFKDGIIEMAQLHGDEDEKYIRNLKDKSIEETGKGSGKTFDWSLLDKESEFFENSIFLAGGLNSENLALAIEEFNPFAVDLSSSVETEGFKDEEKIKKIIEIMENYR